MLLCWNIDFYGAITTTALEKGIIESVISTAHTHFLDSVTAISDASTTCTDRQNQTKEFLNQTKKGLVKRKFASFY